MGVVVDDGARLTNTNTNTNTKYGHMRIELRGLREVAGDDNAALTTEERLSSDKQGSPHGGLSIKAFKTTEEEARLFCIVVYSLSLMW